MEAESFFRRRYTVEGKALDEARRIEVHVLIDGKPHTKLQAREPGIVAIVSKPDEQGFDIEIVEPGGARFVDLQTTAGAVEGKLLPWHKQALALE